MKMSDAQKVLEAVLFSSGEVMSFQSLIQVLGPGNIKGVKELRQLAQALNEDYETTGRTFRVETVGEGLQLRTLPQFKTWVTKAAPLRPIRLTQATLETLAIVAYRQPVARSEVEHLRGVDSSSGLRTLLDKKLIRIVGKDEGPGRALLYGTAKGFLSLFNLQSLKELPQLADLDLRPASVAGDYESLAEEALHQRSAQEADLSHALGLITQTPPARQTDDVEDDDTPPQASEQAS